MNGMEETARISHKQMKNDNDSANVNTSHKSTESSALQYFCGLSDDQEILSEDANNTDHYHVSQQGKCFYEPKYRLPEDCNSKKKLVGCNDKVIDFALEIAATIEMKHPLIRPYISMYLMKKYFFADINYHKFRDHIKCDSH